MLSGAALDAVVFRNASTCTMSTLAAFASVTTVDLNFSGDLDLTALQMLQNLRELHLRDGAFAVNGLAAHTTYLNLCLLTSPLLSRAHLSLGCNN